MIDASQKTILVTDDNPVNVQLIETILQKNGYQTIRALNGKNCLQYALQNQPDLILLDICMPETSGIEVCTRLRREGHTSNIPIIFVTANTDNATLSEAFESGGTDYVRKPINRVELLARIKSALFQQELITKRVQEEKLKGILEMAGAVCHELNQPLQYLIGSSELLLDQLSTDNAIYEDISKIKMQVGKMGEITQKLMRITSYETRQYAGNKKIVDIDKSTGPECDGKREA